MVDMSLGVVRAIAPEPDALPPVIVAMLVAGLSVYKDVMHPVVALLAGAGSTKQGGPAPFGTPLLATGWADCCDIFLWHSKSIP